MSLILAKCSICGYDELLTGGICGVCKGHADATHVNANTACHLCMSRSTAEIIVRNQAIYEATPKKATRIQLNREESRG